LTKASSLCIFAAELSYELQLITIATIKQIGKKMVVFDKDVKAF